MITESCSLPLQNHFLIFPCIILRIGLSCGYVFYLEERFPRWVEEACNLTRHLLTFHATMLARPSSTRCITVEFKLPRLVPVPELVAPANSNSVGPG